MNVVILHENLFYASIRESGTARIPWERAAERQIVMTDKGSMVVMTFLVRKNRPIIFAQITPFSYNSYIISDKAKYLIDIFFTEILV